MNDYERLISSASTQKINLYRYGDRDLLAQELYFCLMVEETMKQLGVQDVYGVILFLLGRPNMPTRAKVKYAIQGTSVASIICRALLDIDMPSRMPTLTGKTLSTLRIRWTTNLGAFIGRNIPYLGLVIGVYDVTMISLKTTMRYNNIVKPEDQINDMTAGTLG